MNTRTTHCSSFLPLDFRTRHLRPALICLMNSSNVTLANCIDDQRGSRGRAATPIGAVPISTKALDTFAAAVNVYIVVVVVVKVILFVATKASAGHLSLSRYEASPQPFNVIVFLFGRGFIHRSVASALVHLPLHGTD